MQKSESEAIGFTTNQIESVSNKIPNQGNISRSHKVGIFACLVAAVLTLFAIVFVVLYGAVSNFKSNNERIKSPEIWQITIGNNSLNGQEINAHILVIPQDLSSEQSLILMHEISVEFVGFNENITNNLSATVVPDTIIELNANYSMNQILTNKNESRNVVLYAFSYLYESCFVECGAACGVSVAFNYSMYCHGESMNHEHSEDILMRIAKVTNLPETDLVSSDVAEKLMHQMLSKYHEHQADNHERQNDLSDLFDENVYIERDWYEYSWSTTDDEDEYMEPTEATNTSNSTEQPRSDDSDRRHLQSAVIDDILSILPPEYQDTLINAITSLFDDTLWVEACGFLLDGCDYFEAEVDSDSFSEWYLGTYYYGIESLCAEFKALPYVSTALIKNSNENTGTIQLTVDLKPYDSSDPAVRVTFHAYTRQKLCVGVILGEWCYRDVRDDVDVQFEINPSFTLDLFYAISLESLNSSNLVLEFGFNGMTTSLSKCDFDYNHDADRSLGDYMSYFIPLINILPLAYDQAVQFLLKLIDANICPLVQEYSQQYLSDQIDKLFDGNLEYLVQIDHTNIGMNNGLIHLYHNIWLNSQFKYSSAFGISEACSEILVDCISNNQVMNNAFATHVPRDGGSNDAGSVWNTDCNAINSGAIPRAIVALYDDDDGFDDIDRMKCGSYINMLTCEYQDSAWIDTSDCHRLHEDDGGSMRANVKWQTQCTDNYVMTAIYDHDNGFNDINDWKCCAINTRQYRIDYTECDVVELNGGNDGGTTAKNIKWRAQCEYNHFVVAMYDDNDGFADVDAMKCCPVYSVTI